MNTLLPISLQVSLEFVKLFQGWLIDNDALMFSFERSKLVTTHTVSIVEDLGQIGYIFSDKTGTLTRNVMEFKYMMVGNAFYGNRNNFEQIQTQEGEGEATKYNKLRNTIKRKSFIEKELEVVEGASVWSCPNFTDAVNSGGDKIKRQFKSTDGRCTFNVDRQVDLINEFFKTLSVAHMCDVEKKADGSLFYNGPSPDEVALVEFA